MSYQVLARKWRPRRFAELIGQEHVIRALVNALDRDQVHHAFLFTGTRGVGKTTIARIFAKSLNCEVGVSSQPCGKCSACEEVDSGRFVDLIEVDAASRTKVEDTRELLENVQYAPTCGRYKVYLIDEVHMLSGHSFNALLKTLEEPPPHVKFLLATTDPQKLPVTILSRCLQFNLKRLSPAQIAGQLQTIVEAEGVSADTESIRLIATAADGSVRDSLSLLDQAIAYGAGKVSEDEVRAMLGTVDRQLLWRLMAAIAAGDAAAAMAEIAIWAEGTPDYDALLSEVIGALQRVAMLQQVPGALQEDVELPQLQALADQLTPETVQLYYQIGLIGRRDLVLSPDPRAGLEMIVLRLLAFQPDSSAQSDGGYVPGRAATISRSAAPTPRPTTRPAPVALGEPGTSGSNTGPASPPEMPAAVPSEPVRAPAGRDWNVIVADLEIGGMALQLAHQCVLKSSQDGVWVLALDAAHKGLRSDALEGQLADALAKKYTIQRLSIEVAAAEVADTPARQAAAAAAARQSEAEEAIANDPTVRGLQERFGATIKQVKPA